MLAHVLSNNRGKSPKAKFTRNIITHILSINSIYGNTS